MILDYFFYILATSIAVVSSYPIFKQQGRFEPQDINFLPEFAMPAPMYGYPAFGDYADSAPAYSELDIVREQLAHPQVPPFIKRYPVNLPYSYNEPIPVDDEEEQNWIENDVSANKPALEMLTEALMETLIRQSEPDTNLWQQEDADLENDQIVQELKTTAVKKSMSLPQPALKKFEKTEEKSTKGSGQKEIPLLRPPVNRPVIFSAKPTSDGTENNKATPESTQQKTKTFGGFTKRRPNSPLVSTSEDLTKELSSLKKIVQ